MKIAITGANGFLGTALYQMLSENNLQCVRLIKNPTAQNDRFFNLENCSVSKLSDLLVDIDVLIHTAYDFKANTAQMARKINIAGSNALFNYAKLSNVKQVILISSMSAHANSKSVYGLTKLAIEHELINSCGGFILRPGLIYGNDGGGITAILQKIAKLPVVPVIGGNAILYLSCITDLCNLIYEIITTSHDPLKNKPIVAANNTAYTFTKILQLFGANRIINLPWQPVYYLLKILELIGIKPRMGSDNLISLLSQNPVPDFHILDSFHTKFKPIII